MKEARFNLANAITLVRVVLALPISLLLVQKSDNGLALALALMAVCELSDWLDGHVARSYNQITAAGKLFDPLADSLYRISVFAAFTVNGWLALWMCLVFVARDLAVAQIRVATQAHGITFGARFSGKAKAFVQGIAQIVTVFAYLVADPAQDPVTGYAVSAILGLAAAVTVYSLIDYVAGGLSATAKQQDE